jgi:BASS family bile acid:Na+ symporter
MEADQTMRPVLWRPSVRRLLGLTASMSHLFEQYFIWLLIGSYIFAAICPGPGLLIRAISFGEITAFGANATVTLPMVMLALLLVNAGLWVRLSRLKRSLPVILVLLVGLGANLAVPLAYIFAATQALRLWPDPTEVQCVVLGLAVIAAMPIAGSSTAWSQMVNGDLSMSLGLVVASTILSPLATPVVLEAVGLMVTGESAEELHFLAADGTKLFLIVCVVIPSVLGIFARGAIGGDRIEAVKHPLRLLNCLNLLALNYANASLSLPEVLAQPDIDFLVLALAIVVGLCVGAFASGWMVAYLMRVDRAQRAALVFGLGMNNNGTGLVLASIALADFPRVMLPIILYNLVQHLVAGAVAYRLGRTSLEREASSFARTGMGLADHRLPCVSARKGS